MERKYNIRCMFAPETEKIKWQDGSIVTGLSLLPSSFFYFEEKKKTYVFHGGGYGHGVGMSQNGVKTMAEKGYGWKKILKHYYQGITLKKVGNIG
jgi:stage II sporulation protein D